MSKVRVTFNIFRYIPDKQQAPTYQTYQLKIDKQASILSTLHQIKNDLDSSLSYRWSCQMAVCGSCGTMVNNQPKLLCSTFIKDYYPQSITVEPLAHFPVIRDLVINSDDFVKKLAAIKPYIINKDKKTLSEGEYIQTPKQVKKYKQQTQCINCLLCYSACPQYGRDDNFIGPAALALNHRYNQDSRDQGADERRDINSSKQGVWECTFAGLCSKVCPKAVDPASAIQQMKLANTMDYFKRLFKIK